MRRLAPLLAALGAASCGYQMGGLYAVRSVRVHVFDNVSNRRIHEFDLTQAIVHEISSRGIRVNAPDAEATLEGRIVDIKTPSVVEDERDLLRVGSLVYRVELRLVDVKGHERFRETRTETVTFAADRGESEATARAEIFDRFARWAVSRLEKEW